MSEHRDRAIASLARAFAPYPDAKPSEREIKMAEAVVDEMACHAVELMWAEMRREEARRT